eukprot:GHUV01051977.1.p1 GENE.GHUV01051977.1~~GHUV01051977.1.p1  ORF type:complete len:145 (-),score=35.99 GHUV01051977.1:581-1015(-)
MATNHTLALLLGLLLVCEIAVAYGARQPEPGQNAASLDRRKKKKQHPYTSPAGLFIQERASKQLPGPGQHFSFGALKPWEDILAMLDDKPGKPEGMQHVTVELTCVIHAWFAPYPNSHCQKPYSALLCFCRPQAASGCAPRPGH